MSDPWAKWYFSDWSSDPGLRCCSLAARGLWIEMLGVMHESPRRGYLLVGNSAPTSRQLASISGSSVKEVNLLLGQLLAAGVYSIEDGIIYSRRMVRDEKKRVIDRENGSKGGNPRLKGGVNPPDNGVDKAQIPEARGQILEKKEDLCPVARATRTKLEYSEDFETNFWKPFPRTAIMSKKEAWREWMKLNPDRRLANCQALDLYKRHLAKNPTLHAVHACRFIAQNRAEGLLETAAEKPKFDVRAHIA